YMGVAPILVVAAPNQVRAAAWMRRHGLAYRCWTPRRFSEGALLHGLSQLLDDTSWRRQFWQRGRALVDGRGAERVVRVLQQRCEDAGTGEARQRGYSEGGPGER